MIMDRAFRIERLMMIFKIKGTNEEKLEQLEKLFEKWDKEDKYMG